MEEKFTKKAIVGTGFGCNSNCLFCLLESRLPSLFPTKRIKEEIMQKRLKGANWLVLSGGEPTIHPDFLEIITFSKKLGYNRIQVISNGRMLSNKVFCHNARLSGLTEATFSFHGSTPELHDGLTRVKGAFSQSVAGVKNCVEEGINITFNMAINKFNVSDISNILKFIYDDLGIRNFDFDAIGTAPTGRSYEKKLFPSDVDLKKSLADACSFAETHDIVLWVTRVPIYNLPKGYEYHKEPWEALFYDAVSIWERIWIDEDFCNKDKCEFCEVSPLCSHIREIKKRKINNSLDYVITDKPFKLIFNGLDESWADFKKRYENEKKRNSNLEVEFQINKQSKEFMSQTENMNVVFSPTNPYMCVGYNFEHSNRIRDTTKSIMSLNEIFSISKGPFKNVPLCIKKGKKQEYYINLKHFDKNKEPIPEKFVKRVMEDIRVFPKKCDECSLRKECPGFFGDYVKLFGFDAVFPKK